MFWHSSVVFQEGLHDSGGPKGIPFTGNHFRSTVLLKTWVTPLGAKYISVLCHRCNAEWQHSISHRGQVQRITSSSVPLFSCHKCVMLSLVHCSVLLQAHTFGCLCSAVSRAFWAERCTPRDQNRRRHVHPFRLPAHFARAFGARTSTYTLCCCL